MNYEHIQKCIDYIGTMYEFQKSEDKEIDEDILRDVIENHLTDLLNFARIILK